MSKSYYVEVARYAFSNGHGWCEIVETSPMFDTLDKAQQARRELVEKYSKNAINPRVEQHLHVVLFTGKYYCHADVDHEEYYLFDVVCNFI